MNNRQRPAPQIKRPTTAQPSRFAPQYDPLAHAMGMQRVIELVHELEALKADWQNVIAKADEQTKTATEDFMKEYRKKLDVAHESITSIKKGNDGYTPVKGKDYFDGDTITPEDIVPYVLAKIPDVKAQNVDMEVLKRSVLASLPFMEQKEGEDHEFSPELLHEALKKKPLQIEHVVGLSRLLEGMDYRLRSLVHGGGDTIKAGANVTLTRNADGTTSVSAASATGTNFETPTGTVNGVNTAFTVANTPKYLIVDNTILIENVDYTLSGLNITITGAPPTRFIRSAY